MEVDDMNATAKPHKAAEKKSMVIRLPYPRGRRPANLIGGKTLETTEGSESSSDELQEHKDEEQNHLSEIQGKGTNYVIAEHGKYEVGQLEVTEECHGHVAQGQGEVGTRQNENTEEYEKQTEATNETSRFYSYEMGINENLSASLVQKHNKISSSIMKKSFGEEI